MSTTTHPHVIYVADRTASREVETLHDWWGMGRLIASGELTHKEAVAQMTAAFVERDLKPSTITVYMSQGAALAELFDDFADLEEWADDEHNGSRSMKRLYDATRVKAEPVAPVAAEAEAEATEPAGKVALVDQTIANLAHLTADEVARVAAACAAILTPAAVKAA